MLLLTLTLTACDPSTGLQPDQLEAASAQPSDVVDGDGTWSAAGLASLSGGERDWTLAVAADAGTIEYELHLPGASDIAALDGTAVEIEIEPDWTGKSRDLVIRDDAGVVLFVQSDEDAPLSPFGTDFARFGSEVGQGTIDLDWGTYGVDWHEAVFQGDEGEVAALPGEPFELTRDGVRYRVVVHSALRVASEPDSVPDCGGGVSDTLAFEMVRVDAEVEVAPVVRVEGAPIAAVSTCG